MCVCVCVSCRAPHEVAIFSQRGHRKCSREAAREEKRGMLNRELQKGLCFVQCGHGGKEEVGKLQ